MDITRAGARQSRQATPDYFTGRVWQDTIVEAPEPARMRARRVTIEPGARTPWHTQPLGQTLQGQAPQVIRPGDTVWIPPGEEHWHGAGPDTMMSHLAMQEAQDGRAADWLEQVDEADYLAAPG